MSQHLSREQLSEYRKRTLSPSDLVAADSHLAGCPECRGGLADVGAATSMVSALWRAKDEHLTYDQMDAWVEDQLDQSGCELVLAHIGLCSPCARQLQAYQGYAPVMSAPIVASGLGSASAPSFAERLRAFLHSPSFAAVASAAVILAVLSPLVLVKRTETARREFAADLRNGSATSPATPSLDTAQLNALPTRLRAGALAALTAQPSERPLALLGLPPNPDANVLYPVSEVVEETQPDFQWKPFADSYLVSIYNSQDQLVARSQMLSETNLKAPVQLIRGSIYSWEIQGGATTHSARFRVLGRSEAQEFSRVRRGMPGPLAMGAVAQSLGLLYEAQQEFQTLAAAQSPQGAMLLDRVTALRGR